MRPLSDGPGGAVHGHDAERERDDETGEAEDGEQRLHADDVPRICRRVQARLNCSQPIRGRHHGPIVDQPITTSSVAPKHPSPRPRGVRMAWRMPAETAPHERTWMAFPRDGHDARRRRRRGARSATRRGPPSPTPSPSSSRSRWSSTRPSATARRACSAATSSIVEAPLDEFWMRDFGPTFVVDDERPGVLGAVDWIFNGWGAPEWARVAQVGRDRPVRRRAGRRRAGQLGARERGRRHPRRRRGHRAAHRDRAARPAPQPLRRPGPRRGRARPHDRHHHTRSGCRAASPATTTTSARTATSTSSRPSRRPGRLLLHDQRDPGHPDFEVTRELRALLADADGCRGPRRSRSSTCPRPRRCATTRASSTGATSTTSSSTAASSRAASARSARMPRPARSSRTPTPAAAS